MATCPIVSSSSPAQALTKYNGWISRIGWTRMLFPDRIRMSPIAEHYYERWQESQPVDGPERFLAEHANLNVVQLVEVLLVDQALRWRDAAGPSVEQYLGRFPVVADQESLVLELVYGEMRAARGLGLTVDADAYVARFPELAEPLRRQMEVSTWLADEGIDSAPADLPPP